MGTVFTDEFWDSTSESTLFTGAGAISSGSLGRAISSTRPQAEVDGLHDTGVGAGAGANLCERGDDEENMPPMPCVGWVEPEPEKPEKMPSPCVRG